jgi:hypothetical protein
MHTSCKYTSIKDVTTGLAFFATPHHGGSSMLVSLGRVAAKIATAVGFQKGDDVLETLKDDGSIFYIYTPQHGHLQNRRSQERSPESWRIIVWGRRVPDDTYPSRDTYRAKSRPDRREALRGHAPEEFARSTQNPYL